MPRPRDPEIDRVIRAAVLDLLVEGGYAHATIDAVAARARVQRPAIYRRFDNRAAMLAEAVRGALADVSAVTSPQTADVRADLARALQDAAALLTKTPLGGIMRALVPEIARDSMLSKALRAVEQEQRRGLRAVLRRAARAKLLRAQMDEKLAVDALLGPLYFRFLFGDSPPTPAFARKLTTLVLRAEKGNASAR